MTTITWHFSEPFQSWYWSDDGSLSWYRWPERTAPDGSNPPTEAPLVWGALWNKMKATGTWAETNEDMYHDMLCTLPPRAQRRGAFLCGEAERHNAEGKAVYAAFKSTQGRYFAKYMTLAEFESEFKNP